jgi:Protein of unknown function (DUF2846)
MHAGKRTGASLTLWALLALLVLLQGCAATGPKGTEMAGRLGDLPEGYGRIVFFRSASLAGAAVQPEIRLDGQVVGRSIPGGFFYVDAKPGKHTASSSTEATSTVEIPVLAGQTQYVRSAISFGIMVGRVTLSVEGTVTAKGELPGLSYTGTQVPQIGDAAAATAAAAAGTDPARPQAAVWKQARPLKQGDALTYRITDGYTGLARDAVLVVDRVDGERIFFAQGGRVETTRGRVESIATPVAGEMDACSPPGGWGPPPETTLGMSWNLRYRKPAEIRDCGGEIELQAQMVSDEAMPTAIGEYKVQRIDYKGTGSRQGFSYAFTARAWYSPVLGRLVKFESERGAGSARSSSPTREKAELVEIRGD